MPDPTPLRRLTQDLLVALYPRGSDRDEYRARVESRGTYLAAGAFVLAVLAGLALYLGRDVPLWGDHSVGVYAALVGGVAAAAGCAAGYLQAARSPEGAWRRALPALQRIIDVVAITVLHVVIVLMLLLIVFFSLQQAFRDLALDPFTAIMITGVTAAIAAYGSFLSATALDARRLSTLLAVFVVAGIMTSMVTAPEPEWWRLHFSELGAHGGVSGISFNLTMIIAGPVLASLALYIVADLRRWEAHSPPSPRRNIRLFGIGFVIVGASLVGVGLVPVNESLLFHNIFATGMAVVFGLLLLSLRWILDGLPRAVFVFSDVLVAGIVLAALLWWPVGYYSLTAVEIIAAAVIFTWLIVFIRNIAALTEGLPPAPARAGGDDRGPEREGGGNRDPERAGRGDRDPERPSGPASGIR